MTEEISLSTLLLNVKTTIKNKFDNTYWVRATIASLTRKSGHMYMELIDSKEGGSANKPKCRATCWNKSVSAIEGKFLKETGISLRSSIDVLLQVKVDFSPEYGFSLNIINIDPQYSVGGIERQMKDVRDALIKAGVYQNNLQMHKPQFFTRIAVLAPLNAAGLEDFKADVSPLSNNKLLDINYFYSPFQGDDCGNKMVYELRNIYRSHNEKAYDCVVIIRGGGAALDLAFLNHFHLANACCKFPIPVFCGIGHATDKTILDEVCHVFDTPSKVSKFIVNAVTTSIESAQKNINTINREITRLITEQRNKSSVFEVQIKNHAEKFIVNNINKIDKFDYIMKSSQQLVSTKSEALSVIEREFKQASDNFIKNEKLNVSLTLKDIKANAKRTLAEQKRLLISTQDNYNMLITRKVIEHLKNLQGVSTQLKSASSSQISNHRSKLEIMVKNVVGFGVDRTIKQGFVLIRDNHGDIVKDGEELSKGRTYHATFRDCEVDLQYKQLTELEEGNFE